MGLVRRLRIISVNPAHAITTLGARYPLKTTLNTHRTEITYNTTRRQQDYKIGIAVTSTLMAPSGSLLEIYIICTCVYMYVGTQSCTFGHASLLHSSRDQTETPYIINSTCSLKKTTLSSVSLKITVTKTA